MITAARIRAEAYTGIVFPSRTVIEYWDCWPCCEIPLTVGPVSSLTSVQYYDSDNALQTWSSANYTADLVSNPARIVKKTTVAYPTLYVKPNAVLATYVAGYASAAAVPEDAKMAIKMFLGFFFENREDIPIGNNKNPYLRSANALLDRLKIAI
jgi:uncharacterized phiE125 gp8 family phage protein